MKSRFQNCDRQVLRELLSAVILVFALPASQVEAATADLTTPLAFVSEFIRELGAGQSIRDNGVRELGEGGAREQTANCVENSEAFQLELNYDARALSDMRLSEKFDVFRTDLIDGYRTEDGLWRELHDICATLLAGPKPGVDYGALAAKAPDINAKLTFEDHAIFDITPAIFLSMVDERPDRSGKLSRLVITTKERKSLIERLNDMFGERLNQENQNWSVSSASLLRDALAKDNYKSADDPN